MVIICLGYHLMCTIGMNNSLTGEQRVDIYGPTGLKNFIRSALMLSYSNLPYTFAVHELSIPSYQGITFIRV